MPLKIWIVSQEDEDNAEYFEPQFFDSREKAEKFIDDDAKKLQAEVEGSVITHHELGSHDGVEHWHVEEDNYDLHTWSIEEATVQ